MVLDCSQGAWQKLLLANNIGLLWAQVREMPIDVVPAATAWLGILAFAFQIYFDFSGYSDMALWDRQMLGFHFQNFNLPYTAKSITDFWRRWHITLSTWFKEYLYIPLGGNRSGTVRTIRNLFNCMGADWLLAWSQLEFCMLGAVLWGAPWSWRNLYTEKSFKQTSSFVRQLYTFCAGGIQLGTL